MIRNIPVNLTQREVLDLIHDKFHKCLLNFFYMPSDISKRSAAGLGFCFINFVSNTAAYEFRRAFSGRSLLPGGFPLAISTASVQGLADNIENVRLNPTITKLKNPNLMPLAKDHNGYFKPVNMLDLPPSPSFPPIECIFDSF
jgi:hypothetical protein